MLPYFILVVFLLKQAESEIFTCPKSPITPNASNSSIRPLEATNLTHVPAGTNCIINFHVPAGYALRTVSNVTGVAGSDIFLLRDTVGMKYRLVNCTECHVWLAKGNSTLKMFSPNGTLSFHVKYRYQLLNELPRHVLSTGNDLVVHRLKKTIYKFNASIGDRLAISVGLTKSSDTILNEIFVYDGFDISSAIMIGTLAHLMAGKDRYYFNGSTLQLVNLYGIAESDSVIVLNDASAVERLPSYSITAVSDRINKTIRAGLAYTFVSSTFDTLTIENMSISTENGTAYIQSRSPSHRLPKLLEYRNGIELRTRFPQVIPTDMFTIYAIDGNVTLSVASKPKHHSWTSLSDNHKGMVFSQNQWNRKTGGIEAVNFTSENYHKLYDFKVDFDTVEFGNNETSIYVEIGRFTGTHSILKVNQTFTEANKTIGSRSAKGNFMHVVINNSVDTTDIRLIYSADIIVGPAYWKIVALNVFILYIPILLVMFEKENFKMSCFKIMIFLTIVDMMALFVNSIATGFLAIHGAVYCTYPNFIYLTGMAGLGLWCCSCTIAMFLVMNRLLDLAKPQISVLFFEGNRTFLVLTIPLLYGLYFMIFTTPCAFTSKYLSWFFDPMIFPNMSHMSLQIFFQSALICAINQIASIIYVVMNFITVPLWLIYLGHICWQFGHGAPALIYLGLNKTIRYSVLKKCGLLSRSKVSGTGLASRVVVSSVV